MRTMAPTFAAIVVALLFLSPSTVPAAPKGAAEMTGEQAAGVVFTEIEKRIIRDYFGKHPESVVDGHGGGKGKSKKMPPGLAKREHLPPGLEMQIEKNGTLPPGLAKRDLPAGLVSDLPRARPGTVRKIVGNDVVLVQEATGIVLDVLRGVLNKK